MGIGVGDYETNNRFPPRLSASLVVSLALLVNDMTK